MEIDPHNLPEDAAALRQMVVSLLQELDSKERRLTRVQHLLEQLLRAEISSLYEVHSTQIKHWKNLAKEHLADLFGDKRTKEPRGSPKTGQ